MFKDSSELVFDFQFLKKIIPPEKDNCENRAWAGDFYYSRHVL